MATRKTSTPRKTARATPKATTPWAVLESAGATTRQRVAALGQLDWTFADDRARYRAVLALATDAAQPAPVREAALSAAHSVSFNAQRFPALRPDYLRALRKLGEDGDPELRQRALGMLMREGDAATEQRLLAGLADPAQALLPTEKTLQLLSYQLHAETYAAARRVAQQPGDPGARREALRLLAADASATPIFERVIADKKEPSELRRLAATALHQLAPATLQQLARDITLDDDDDEELRTSCLVALANFGDAKAIAGDSQLQAQVGRLSADAGSAATGTALNEAAQRFLGRYGH